MSKDRIILALDVGSISEAESLVGELKEYVGVYKVGKELFTSEGPAVVRLINEKGGKVFLDLKYHDIPNTVSKAAVAASKLGVYMMTLHASGGSEMMRACADAVKEYAASNNSPKPLLLGVTVLTSLTEDVLADELKVKVSVREQVANLASLAQKSGLDGVVCSPKEISLVRETCGEDFLIVTPGIRPEWAASNDQKRITTPSQAMNAGADYLVIGRPITKAEDRASAAKRILSEIENL